MFFAKSSTILFSCLGSPEETPFFISNFGILTLGDFLDGSIFLFNLFSFSFSDSPLYVVSLTVSEVMENGTTSSSSSSSSGITISFGFCVICELSGGQTQGC